ncbi:competence type IV pilus major pilin ComGC [Paenisporosarcina cavernae]|uniref:ComG operon protein 3 n=1 Tax=Paenisporosarcina cavernae TaxID=2320858 RepID=A0A385YVM8_9BACL|nr:competence type IV pilus major pilin ComGC [Paenisporosarcina cavernae]AYC29563.1 prepilin-type N-terminal cleavage/methylation domain-containing protein [Paenisporosarcina cavernae]
MIYIRNEKAFTLIEMMMVLLIISVLILIAIPNVTKHSATIDEKGCQAFMKMIEGQVEAYQIENKSVPTLQNLTDEDYLTAQQQTCPDGRQIDINAQGEVSVAAVASP